MKEILQTIRYLNAAFGHDAEPVFINTVTKEIDDRYAPSLRRHQIPPSDIGEWIEGNFGFVHPDYPNLLFFAVDRLEEPELFACCPELPIFMCSLCGAKSDLTPKSLAQHEWIHSLQLRLNPYISHTTAERIADAFEDINL